MPTESNALARGLGAVIDKDSTPYRQSLFDRLTQQRPTIRFARAAHRRLPRLLAQRLPELYGWAAAATTAPPAGKGDIITAARYRNEQRQFSEVASASGLGRVPVPLGRDGLAAGSWRGMLGVLADSESRRRMRREVGRQDDFLVACRVAETVGCWLRLRGRLAKSGARIALVSSDTNPYAVALMAAAREEGIAVVYINHGHLPAEVPPLDVDLAIFDGEALHDLYRRVGDCAAEVVYRGSEGRYRPMRTGGLSGSPRIGVFCSLSVDWPVLGARIEELRRCLRARSLLIRLHPNRAMRDPAWRKHLRLRAGDEVSDGGTVLLEDAAACDLVVVGNSSSHLSVLKHGVPSLQVPGLDLIPHDQYGFVRDRIVLWTDSGDLPTAAQIASFYDDPDWGRRFARYDAAYPGRDEECADRVGAALRHLAGRAGSSREQGQ
jgi:hypothetical protein